jgi:hypothetical protein
MTDEEKKALQVFEIDGMPRTVDEIKSRRKKKGDFQYEVSWKGLPSIKYNKWFTREVCIHHTLYHLEQLCSAFAAKNHSVRAQNKATLFKMFVTYHHTLYLF